VSTPVDPVGVPLIPPAPAAQRVVRSRRSGGDDDRRPPREPGGEPRRRQPDAEDGEDGLPHVDVRA
jgi:hypothetical protein